jgi:acetylornithine/N-succinyldiaminopimelate aminotransferase
MRANEKVKLKTFNRKLHSDGFVEDSEDYWKLIGDIGVVQQDPQEVTIYASFSKEPRVLVKFKKSLESLGLISHNNIKNSLWIMVDDLEIVK